MAKSYLEIDDFFAGIMGTEEDLEIPGLPLPVRVRSLETVEVQQIRAASGDNEMEMTVRSVICGMVQPKLTAEHIERLFKAKPGAIQKIARRIMQLSGMIEDEDAPLAGAGS